jgi:glycosyltransferase involved in cell wall biosynthesis
MTLPLRITMVTPSLNQRAFVERAVRSVLDQQGDFELEYLVYDAGSTDGTLDVLRRYEQGIRLVVEPDTGQPNAINKGLRAATGDVVGWLNSDDLLYPGALERVARAFRNRPDLLWLHGGCEIVDEQDRPIRRWVTAYKDRRCRRYSRRSLLVENFVSQMTVFWRRAAIGRIGLLDEGMHLSFDYEYWLRLAGLGDPVYLPERIAAFRWYTSSKSGSSFEAQSREEWEAFLRHAPKDRWLRLQKRLRLAQIQVAYRTMRAVGRLRWLLPSGTGARDRAIPGEPRARGDR